MSQPASTTIAVMGIDVGKNSFHVVALDQRGAIMLRQRWSRGQVETRLANIPPCLVGMEACVGAHHLSRKLKGLGHDARLMPAACKRLPCATEIDRLAPRGGKLVIPDNRIRSSHATLPGTLALLCSGRSAWRHPLPLPRRRSERRHDSELHTERRPWHRTRAFGLGDAPLFHVAPQ